VRFWDDKDGNGNKLTDGRVCLVIQNPEMPEIRTYGKDKDEVLEKLATTTETAQLQISRMRKTPANQPPARPTTAPAAATPNGDLVTAVADMANPQKAPQAVKTLLRAAGVDVDRQARADAALRMGDVAEQWEREHPEYPKDPRNDQILMNKALLMAGGPLRVTAEIISTAFEELQRLEMLFEVAATPVSTVQPSGSSDSRTVRGVQTATSYRRNALRSAEPPPAPRGDSAKEARWRTILEHGNSAQQAEAIRNEPGYVEWVDKVTQKKAG
jgi:hypothetical protein